jgi:hypothetical protein
MNHSCTNDKITYYILTTNADNISDDTEIFHKGVKVGYVEKVAFEQNSVLLTIQINRDFSISKTANIFLGTKDLTTRTINIHDTFNSVIFYKEGDTIKKNLDFFTLKIDKFYRENDSIRSRK